MALVPTIGRIVTYVLNASDVSAICQANGKHNPPAVGDEYPAMIVRVWPGFASVNLQVFYDGDGSYWATSRAEGEGQGTWHHPVTVAGGAE